MLWSVGCLCKFRSSEAYAMHSHILEIPQDVSVWGWQNLDAVYFCSHVAIESCRNVVLVWCTSLLPTYRMCPAEFGLKGHSLFHRATMAMRAEEQPDEHPAATRSGVKLCNSARNLRVQTKFI